MDQFEPYPGYNAKKQRKSLLQDLSVKLQLQGRSAKEAYDAEAAGPDALDRLAKEMGLNYGTAPRPTAPISGPTSIFRASGVGGPNPKIDTRDYVLRGSMIEQIRQREIAQIAQARAMQDKRKELQAEYYQTGNRVIKVDASGLAKYVPSPEELYDLGDPIAGAQMSLRMKANQLAKMPAEERMMLGDIDIGKMTDSADIRAQAMTMKAVDEFNAESSQAGMEPLVLGDADIAAMGYSNAPKAINPYMAVASGNLEQMQTALEQRLHMVERAKGDSSKDGEVSILMKGIEKAMERQGKQSSSEVKDDQARQKELARLQEAFHDTSLEYEKRKAELGIPASGEWPKGAADDPTLRLLREKKDRIKRQAQSINGAGNPQVSAQGQAEPQAKPQSQLSWNGDTLSETPVEDDIPLEALEAELQRRQGGGGTAQQPGMDTPRNPSEAEVSPHPLISTPVRNVPEDIQQSTRINRTERILEKIDPPEGLAPEELDHAYQQLIEAARVAPDEDTRNAVLRQFWKMTRRYEFSGPTKNAIGLMTLATQRESVNGGLPPVYDPKKARYIPTMPR